MGLMSAWVASAPWGEACGQSAPTAKNFVATATPKAPVAGSRATIDQVMGLVSGIRPTGTRRGGRGRLGARLVLRRAGRSQCRAPMVDVGEVLRIGEAREPREPGAKLGVLEPSDEQ